MPIIGITGGIATGKSSFARAFLRCLPAVVFDADRTAHELLSDDSTVRLAVEEAFGSEIFDVEGRPNRARLRDLIFSDDLQRHRLEEILHPAIRARWLTLARRVEAEGGWLFVDLPLLYETGAENQFDRVVVVACSAATQRLRLESERGLDPALAVKIISTQLNLPTKIARADHVVWTDSTPDCLDGQADLLGAWLRNRYG